MTESLGEAPQLPFTNFTPHRPTVVPLQALRGDGCAAHHAHRCFLYWKPFLWQAFAFTSLGWSWLIGEWRFAGLQAGVYCSCVLMLVFVRMRCFQSASASGRLQWSVMQHEVPVLNASRWSWNMHITQRISREEWWLLPMYLMLEIALVRELGSLLQSKLNFLPEDNVTE